MWVPSVRCCVLSAYVVLALAGGAVAQTGPAQPGEVGADSGPAKPVSDPVVAEVDGHFIRLSDVGNAIRTMPGGGGGSSLEALYPVVLRGLIEREALLIRARADGVADDPATQRQMQAVADQVLENAYLRHATAPLVTDQMLSARYDAEIAGKPGPEEVHAQAILAPTDAKAQEIIAKLAAGADFGALAQEAGSDGTAASGDDLGFVRRDALGPEVGAVLFALRPGEVTPYPVRTAAGWFVLRVEARRPGPTPTFAEAHNRLEAEAEHAEVAAVVRAALNGVAVRAYDINGH